MLHRYWIKQSRSCNKFRIWDQLDLWISWVWVVLPLWTQSVMARVAWWLRRSRCAQQNRTRVHIREHLLRSLLWRAAAPLSDLIALLLLLRLVVVWGNNKVQPSIIQPDQRGLSVVIDKSSRNNRLLELCPGTAGFGWGFALIFGLNKKELWDQGCGVVCSLPSSLKIQPDLKGTLLYMSLLSPKLCVEDFSPLL